MSTRKALLALALVSAVVSTCISCSRTPPDPVCPQMERVLAAMPSWPEEGFESKHEYSEHQNAVYASIEASGVDIDASEFVAELCSCASSRSVDALVAKFGTDRVIELLSRGAWVASELGDAASGATLIRARIIAGENPKHVAYTVAYFGSRAENGVAWTVQVMRHLFSQDPARSDVFIRCMLAHQDDKRSTQTLLEEMVQSRLEFDREIFEAGPFSAYEMDGTGPLLKTRT